VGDSHRYLGLELAGAKNQKTALATLEYYPKEKKIFLLDIFDRIAVEDHQSGDEALLAVVEEHHPGIARMGVNVALELPPCITCVRKTCPLTAKCTVPAVKWMRDITRRTAKSPEQSIRVREFTSYTQRPIELWARYQVLSRLPEAYRFEIDETLGGNRAPLSARMNFLKRHLGGVELVEVWPKLSTAILALDLDLDRKIVAKYRHLEEGVHAREEILEKLADARGVFIYERDVRKLSQSLASFDAFICAYTALLSDTGACAKPPSGFPVGTGWIQYPELDF